MELITFKPLPDTDASVTGYLHTPIWEMNVRREEYPAVVVCPGGGYEMVSEREAEPIALPFFARGYNVFVLTYSTGEKARDFVPLRELSETVRAVRSHREWRVIPDKIAVCGFSAGGHLACSLGAMWDDPELLKRYDNHGEENRPNAMILGYPVITADNFAHVGSIEHVSGSKEGTPEYEYFSLDRHVSEKTCPAFVWHTAADDCVPVENTLKLLLALQKHKIPYEAHIFPTGWHGMSSCTAETCGEGNGELLSYNARWLELAVTWLDRQFGFRL